MATNPYFKSAFSSIAEQSLLQALTNESIQIHGRDCYYIPREQVAFDQLYGEDKLSAFNVAYQLEFYIENVMGFSGDGDFISKFGLEIRDEMKLAVSRERFKKEVSVNQPEIIRPREGDLIYFPLDVSLFEVTYVENEPVFYQLGHLFTWKVSCKKFELAAESFDTGIDVIDNIQDMAFSTSLDLAVGSGNYTPGEMVYQGASLAAATASGEVVLWTAGTSTLVLTRVKGSFDPAVAVVGVASGASWTYDAVTDVDPVSNEPNEDNNLLNNTTDIVDSTEVNPYSV